MEKKIDKKYKIGIYTASILKKYYKNGDHYYTIYLSRHDGRPVHKGKSQGFFIYLNEIGHIQQILTLCSIYISENVFNSKNTEELF